eukprot:2197417-Amphidinium_carterae.1
MVAVGQGPVPSGWSQCSRKTPIAHAVQGLHAPQSHHLSSIEHPLPLHNGGMTPPPYASVRKIVIAVCALADAPPQ